MQKLTSWLKTSPDSDFSIYNLPFGIFSVKNEPPRAGIAVGDKVIDLKFLVEKGLIDVPVETVSNQFLNDFISLGKSVTSKVRMDVQEMLCDEHAALKELETSFINQAEVKMHLPVRIGDYTDFYSSKEHATNVGKIFRDPENALLPNWKHMPVAYHGRSSSIGIGGENIIRPWGQVKPKGADSPVFQPTSRLDFELETGFIVGKNSQQGQQINVADAEEYIFGKVLLNDWSARDIQSWEYVPLGPFLGKNFATSISSWVVTMDALQPFKVKSSEQKPEVLPYLKVGDSYNFDINLTVSIQPENTEETLLCRSSYSYLYWTMNQQLAHHTVNGCNVNIGDLMGSGTISGATPDTYGSMLELSWDGSKAITISGGSERTFLEDYDTVIIRGFAEKNYVRVGFGEVRNMVLPAN
jgi:fumarylacetoacetase